MIYESDIDFVIRFYTSPAESLIALIETKEGFCSPKTHEFEINPVNRLTIIDSIGNIIDRLDDDVRKLSWSSDGNKIAYITGTYYEGGVGFSTSGVWIYNLDTRTKTEIKKDFPHKTLPDFKGGGYEINWAKHDNNIYIRDFDYLDGIYRYNTITGKSEKVDYIGIDISPDGKYYIEASRVYVTASNEEITDQMKQRFGPVWKLIQMEWVFDKGHLMRFVSQDVVKTDKSPWERPLLYHVIYDIEADKVLKDIELPLSHFQTRPGTLVYEKDEQFVIDTYEKVKALE